MKVPPGVKVWVRKWEDSRKPKVSQWRPHTTARETIFDRWWKDGVDGTKVYVARKDGWEIAVPRAKAILPQPPKTGYGQPGLSKWRRAERMGARFRRSSRARYER